MKLRLFFSSFLAVAAVVACSGADGTELFSPSKSAAPTDPDLSEDDAPATSDGTSSGSSGASSSSGSSGGGKKKDAGKDSATPPPPPPPPTTTISCGQGKTCKSGTQVCCLEFGWDDDEDPTFECKPSSGVIPCPVGANKIACDDRTDCPANQVCCGTFEENTGHGGAECRTTCKSIPGIRAGILCDPLATVDECAASNKFCGPSQTLPGYFVCQD